MCVCVCAVHTDGFGPPEMVRARSSTGGTQMLIGDVGVSPYAVVDVLVCTFCADVDVVDQTYRYRCVYRCDIRREYS